MHGLGNDFVIFDARETPFDVTPPLARAHRRPPHRRRLRPADRARAERNAPTSRCESGTMTAAKSKAAAMPSRCVVALTGAKTIETDGGLVEGAADGDEVEVALGEPNSTGTKFPSPIAMDTTALPMAWDELEKPMARQRRQSAPRVLRRRCATRSRSTGSARGSRHDPAFPERINVNVAEVRPRRLRNCAPGNAAPA